jgi:hypothetical protein
MMEAASTSGKSVNFYQTTQHNPKTAIWNSGVLYTADINMNSLEIDIYISVSFQQKLRPYFTRTQIVYGRCPTIWILNSLFNTIYYHISLPYILGWLLPVLASKSFFSASLWLSFYSLSCRFSSMLCLETCLTMLLKFLALWKLAFCYIDHKCELGIIEYLGTKYSSITAPELEYYTRTFLR